MEKEIDREDLVISEMIKGDPQRPLREIIIALIASLIVLASSFWNYSLTLELMVLAPDQFAPGFLEIYNINFYLGLLAGGLILAGGFLTYLKRRRGGGTIIIGSSIFAFISPGAGFIIGPILGIVAGLLAFSEPKPPEPGTVTEVI